MLVDAETRKEVRQFVEASRTLLSVCSEVSDLNTKERETIAEEVMNLSRSGHPWANRLLQKCA